MSFGKTTLSCGVVFWLSVANAWAGPAVKTTPPPAPAAEKKTDSGDTSYQDQRKLLLEMRAGTTKADEQARIDTKLKELEDRKNASIQTEQRSGTDTSNANTSKQVDAKQHPQEKSPSGDCVASADFNVYNCGMTRGTITAAQVLGAAGQAAGSLATASSGGQISQNSGSQPMSQTLNDTSKMANTAGKANIAVGAIEVVVGGALLFQAGTHGKAAKKIETATNGQAADVWGRAQTLDEAGKNYAKRMGYNATTAPDATSQNVQGEKIQGRAVEAVQEQNKIKDDAKGAAATAITTGIGNIAAGLLAQKSAKNLADAAADLKDAEDKAEANAPGIGGGGIFNPDGSGGELGKPADGVGVTPPAAGTSGDPFAPSQPTILGNGVGASAGNETPTETAKNDGAGGDLGTPFNPNGDNAGKTGGDPGKLGGPGGAGGAQGGGGAGVRGGAATAPASDTSGADGSPRLADNREKANYESGGAYGGALSGGGGADKGPDLSGLLAMLKGAEEKKDEKGPNSILEYGNRGPAGEPISLLDQRVNIFERIHETYQDKHRRGAVKGLGSGG
jgi:hypothetical protein